MKHSTRLPSLKGHWFFLVVLLNSTVLLKAQSHQNEIISLRSKALIYFADQKQFEFNEVLDNADLSFIPLTDIKENVGFSNSHYWLKFTLVNPTDQQASYFPETAGPITDIATLYLIDGDGQNVERQYSGDKIPFDREIG
ncbi:hypothetical protein NYZ99_19475 [Maribacter litopenaei]|uniref:7TM-DISM receptor extracellular domain-containing protein n=1 Tax=Maribacter litopenaei TaxID=2976127 RepID=A0ABY5Y7L9_9FLAO|nr:7TM-DISM domain-containing protein [Maribacter litopenaei]UWX54889.1 hypothetical protein NYZ99_19475 [Maribacter litopenaei]